jgi:hypothetical protein
LTVRFHNRSASISEGWWDFGDGSPLEPVAPQQEVLTHTYVNPGDYTAKLVVRNLLGEESERPVTIHLDAPKTDPPTILALDATPVSPGAYAPATFRVTSKSKNAQLCVWDLGDDRPLEISNEMLDNQERLVTFGKPGGYVIKMAAVNGREAVERSEVVYVNEPPTGSVVATLNVTDQATRVQTERTPYTFHETFPPYTKEDTCMIVRQVPAKQGDYEIIDVRLRSADGPGLQGKTEMPIDATSVGSSGARNLRLQLAPDHRSVRLTGELVKDSRGGLPSVFLPVVLVQERRTRATRPPVPVTATLNVPGSAVLGLPPLPPNWVEPQRQLRFELLDGTKPLWQGSQLPYNAPLVLHNQQYSLTARQTGNQVQVELKEAKPGFTQAAR